jgi:hypothetical protein
MHSLSSAVLFFTRCWTEFKKTVRKYFFPATLVKRENCERKVLLIELMFVYFRELKWFETDSVSANLD